MKTKWDLIDEEERRALDATACGLRCSYCRVELVTEGDFARHFVVPDVRYKNLGWCPGDEEKVRLFFRGPLGDVVPVSGVGPAIKEVTNEGR